MNLKLLLKAQEAELNDYMTYTLISKKIKNKNNKIIIEKIAQDELKHYNALKFLTKRDVKYSKIKVWLYYFIARILGLSFGLKLMEMNETYGQKFYTKLARNNKMIQQIIKDEIKHERVMLSKIKEQQLEYASSIVLGLNDALVELTGTLAGLTLAIQDPKIIAITGLVLGVAASLSMAASGYLSSKADSKSNKRPILFATYTGLAYITTVLMLVAPFLLLNNVFLSLGISLLIGFTIILFYTFYISVAKDLEFKKTFLEMIIISSSVAVISFIFGYIIRMI